jgi:hypothetical protein
VPDGEAVVLDVGQLQSLLAKTFNVGLDVGRGKEPVALVRLRLAKALIGVAEANALAAESIAIERGIGTEDIAQTEALALHAAAFNGMPDPVFHLTARAMAIVMGLAAVEPDPRAPDSRTAAPRAKWEPETRRRPPGGTAADARQRSEANGLDAHRIRGRRPCRLLSRANRAGAATYAGHHTRPPSRPRKPETRDRGEPPFFPR